MRHALRLCRLMPFVCLCFGGRYKRTASFIVVRIGTAARLQRPFANLSSRSSKDRRDKTLMREFCLNLGKSAHSRASR